MGELKEAMWLVEMEKRIELASATGEYYMDKCPKVGRAHRHIRLKLNRGEIIVPEYCTNCGMEEELDVHHDNYNLPDTMRFLCRDCHVTWHICNDTPNWDGDIYEE